MRVFIILLNWNNWAETQECLKSLEKVDYPNFQVLVVDNNSKEEERRPIRDFATKVSCFMFHVSWNDENKGFAGGNNVGIKYALEHGADYIMLLNNDTIVAPDFLAELVKAAESDPNFGILGSRIFRYGTEEIVFEGGKINKWLTRATHQNQAGSDPNCVGVTPQQIREVGYITGAAMLIRREVIEKVGLMREEYFLYYEDVDWCIRARRAGYKCVLVPTSKVWHKVSATTKEGSPSYIYYHTRNALMLAKFNGTILQKIAAYFIGAWILLKQIPKFFFTPQKRIWATSMTKGVLAFYKGKYGKYENRH